MASTDTRVVAVYFSVEMEVPATSEPEAILRAGPKIHELEEQLNNLGYNFALDTVRVRRPRASEPAKRREAAKKSQLNDGRE